MDDVQQTLDDIRSPDKEVQGRAYQGLIEATDQPVDWAYEVWGQVVADLQHDNNRTRSIAAQILCNLAKSDPDERIIGDFPRLLDVTRDDRFVTARHCLQSLWKVGVVGAAQREVYREAMAQRFTDCRPEKNWTLFRSDILQSLLNVYEHTEDESIRTTALELMDSEEDEKQRKKYAKVWKAAIQDRTT